jgi:hypothetical protein
MYDLSSSVIALESHLPIQTIFVAFLESHLPILHGDTAPCVSHQALSLTYIITATLFAVNRRGLANAIYLSVPVLGRPTRSSKTEVAIYHW